MQILESLKFVLRPLIDPSCDPRIHKYLKVAFLLSVSLLILASIYFIAENIHDFAKAIHPSYLVMCWMLGYVKLSQLEKHKEQIHDILELLQETFDESEYIRSKSFTVLP